jgi:F420-dependent oxidoreductase-like protein
VKLGLQISRFRWPGGPPLMAQTLASIARTADEAGYAAIWLMDHFFQIASIGKPEEAMLEAYTTLGFLAAHTRRARLGTLVTGVHYRHPGLLVKQVTTLDVLSQGRAWLGIGAGWYERESKGLGAPFPSVKERFERLEETLQIAHQMWRGDTSDYNGTHYHLERPLNSPPVLSQPHPPIMIGGGGEQKTLRMVARYADASNLFARTPRPDVERKFGLLQQYCAEAGRSYDSIEKTALVTFDPRQPLSALVDELGPLQELGFGTAILSLRDITDPDGISRAAEAVQGQLKPA